MRIEMATKESNKYGFDLQFRLSEKETQRELALGKIGIVFITRDDRKVTSIPPAFLTKVHRL